MTERQLSSIFRQERHTFARAFSHVARAGLEVRDRHYVPSSKLSLRDFGWFDYDTFRVVFLRRVLDQPEATVRGLIRHELGHAADTSNAAGSERRADALALAATGQPVRYDAQGVQNARHGQTRRPDWLHQ